MNIYDYIDEYGIYSFEQKKINEIDCVLFSFLSYADFSNIFMENDRITIKDAARIHLGLYPKKDTNVIAVREGNKLLRYIKDTERYKNCILFNYEYIGNNSVQFGAISIEYQPNKIYVSFEGTDQLFSGWKENFMLSYQFPTLSHQYAISYLNKNYTLSLKKLIIGGHSKGGNLALVASMYANYLVRKKIEKVYNADGPGLLDKEFNSTQYKKLKGKYIHIIPDYSLVGLFLNHENDKIVQSSEKGILAHNIVYWQINKIKFKRTELSPLSKELDKEIKKWFIKYSQADTEYFPIFTKYLEDTIEKSKIKSILELKEEKINIINLIHDSKDMDENTKKLLTDFILIIIKCFRDTKKEEIKKFISNMFKINKNDKKVEE